VRPNTEISWQILTLNIDHHRIQQRTLLAVGLSYAVDQTMSMWEHRFLERQAESSEFAYRQCSTTRKYKAIITYITATVLCSDKTGALATNKLTIDRPTIRMYGPSSEVIKLAAMLPYRGPGCHQSGVVNSVHR
jgi:hypothetical protein